MANIYEQNLDKNAANYAPLTPISLLSWSADVYPNRLAVVHGKRRFTWGETRARCRRLASALKKRGIGTGDTVSAMLSNTPEMFEAKRYRTSEMRTLRNGGKLFIEEEFDPKTRRGVV